MPHTERGPTALSSCGHMGWDGQGTEAMKTGKPRGPRREPPKDFDPVAKCLGCSLCGLHGTCDTPVRPARVSIATVPRRSAPPSLCVECLSSPPPPQCLLFLQASGPSGRRPRAPQLDWCLCQSVQTLPSTQKGPHRSTLSALCTLPEATLCSPVPTLEYPDRSSEARRPCSHIPCLPVASGQPCSPGRPGERD